ncbi:MAG TPA: hypothetical protein VF601_18635 [Beijerinckiaceae bacterium]|jgi:hypothetical protein
MKAVGILAVLAAIAALLVVSARFTERRSVATWAPNAAVAAKPKPAEIIAASAGTAAQAPTLPVQVSLPAPSSELAAATRLSTPDPDATGGLPKEVESAVPAPAEAAPAAREPRRPSKPVRHTARAPESSLAPRQAAVRDPIQFRLAEGNR